MKALYDSVCAQCSKQTTNRYSTSFSLGIKLFHPSIRPAIYGIYGFVRFADEIVDTFHDYDKAKLLSRFKLDTYEAIKDGISLNPILQSFQEVVNEYNIDHDLIELFFNSMEMDLNDQEYDEKTYEKYILGSAEVVGLMCLFVFVDGNLKEYNRLKHSAQKLGAAFQKVNFLRDIKHDVQSLNRNYFPSVIGEELDTSAKVIIEKDIQQDFDQALVGIKQLPKSCRLGVYLAYKYFRTLFNKIKVQPAEKIMKKRIRINNVAKLAIMVRAYFLISLIQE